jgi:3-deoxy-manno-octulosonate cytidylyltransferase (CMP-KDO synthetase)
VTVASRSAVAIVPVRIGSQRLPGKAMLAESGRPLFLHTWQRAVESRRFDGGVYIRTGSERCAEASAPQIPCRAVLDIQGDWPEVEPRDLEALVDQLLRRRPSQPPLCVPLRDESVRRTRTS